MILLLKGEDSFLVISMVNKDLFCYWLKMLFGFLGGSFI